MSDREYVWVSKEVANALKECDSPESHLEVMMKVIEGKKKDFTISCEELDANLLLFKAVCAKHRIELKDTYSAQAIELEKLWEEMGDIGSEIRRHVEKAKEDLKPIQLEVQNLREELRGIRSLLNALSIPEGTLRLMNEISRMDAPTREFLRQFVTDRTPDQQDNLGQ